MHPFSNPGAATTWESWHSHRSELSDVEEMERAKVLQTTTLTTISYFFQYSTRLSIKYLKTVHHAMLWIKINANKHSGCELLIWEWGGRSEGPWAAALNPWGREMLPRLGSPTCLQLHVLHKWKGQQVVLLLVIHYFFHFDFFFLITSIKASAALDCGQISLLLSSPTWGIKLR